MVLLLIMNEVIRLKRRFEYIDIAKGLGILFVVLVHNDLEKISPFFYKLILSFNMPLFLFISGRLFKPEDSFFSLISKRFNSVLKPYIVILFLIFFMTIAFSKVNIDIAAIHLLKSFYSTDKYLDWIPLWFLPHLFLLYLFAYLFYRTFPSSLPKTFKLFPLFVIFGIGVYFVK